MSYLDTVLSTLLSSGIASFLATVFYSITLFQFMSRLMPGLKRLHFFLLLGCSLLNGGLAVFIQLSSRGATNLMILSLISILLVPEMIVICRGKTWPYFSLYWMSALSLQSFYILGCAIVNLIFTALWETGSAEHRFAIYALSMLFTGFFFFFNSHSSPSFIRSLSQLIHDPGRSLLLIVYMGMSTAVLAISSRMLSPLIYSDRLAYSIQVPMYTDMLLKNILILGSSFLIVIFQVRQEQIAHRSAKLAQNLQTERSFRANLHSDALLSYCANITRDCFVEGFGNFAFDSEAGYRESLFTFLLNSIHPEDMDVLSEMSSPEYYEQHLNGDPSFSLRMRIFPKAMLSLPGFRLSPELTERLNSDREWMWMEFHVTVVKDSSSGDILVYVSLNSVDAEVCEREALVHAANTDPLTKLLNRSGMEQMLGLLLEQEGACGTLFILDMDYFKSVNDLLGHPTGDQALRDLADILRSDFRERDVIARLGGDEFCVFAPDMVNPDLVAHRARQLGQRCARTYCAEGGEPSVQVSLSIGCAILAPGDASGYDELYHRADNALYRSKEAGRNTYHISTPDGILP